MKSLVSLVAFSISLQAQAIKFEVASVKMRPSSSLITVVGGSPSGSRLVLEAMTLYDLICWAYDIKSWQVVGGPAWAGTQKDRTTLDGVAKRFDVTGKAQGETVRSPEEFRQMMQELLADRFKLAIHSESRDTPVYSLLTERNGPKFLKSAGNAKGVLRMSGSGKITGSGASIAQLANWFSNANGVERPVVDETGLTGHYDFTLEWSNPLNSTPDSFGPSIFTAMREQLGLRLEPRHAPVKVVAIDHAEMPGEN